jgi:hypothetical protein
MTRLLIDSLSNAMWEIKRELLDPLQPIFHLIVASRHAAWTRYQQPPIPDTAKQPQQRNIADAL